MVYKDISEAGVFDHEFTIELFLAMGNSLLEIKEILNFEWCRPILEPVSVKENRKSNDGRCGRDPVFMMKVMFLQRL